MRKNNVDVSIVLLIAIALIVAGGVVFVYLLATSRLDILKNNTSEERVVNTLFVIEHKKKPVASYIVLYYPATKRAAIFDIPGDIGRIIKQINRVDRIDTIYDSRHLNAYLTEVENLLGIDVNYTIVFDLDALKKIVDILDGVGISIPAAVEIYDGENTVLFPSGRTNLDGDKACKYLLYENSNEENELARLRHQRFFVGLIKRIGEKNNYLKNEHIDKMLSSLLRTNMSRRTRIRLFDEFAKIDTDRITIRPIDGNYREVSGQRLLIPHYDGSLIKDIIRQTLTALTRQGDRADADRVITVEVLNGTSIAGLAGRTAELIRSFGYDVINIGNADRNDYQKTQIIDRVNHPQDAENFSEIIRCNNIILDTSKDEFETNIHEYNADFTLIIGEDFNGRFIQ